MVQSVSALLPIKDGAIDLSSWLNKIIQRYPDTGVALLRQSCSFMQLSCEEVNTRYGSPTIEQALETANILINSNMDYESVAAAIVYPCLQYTEMTVDDISEHLGERIAKLVNGIEQLNTLEALGNINAKSNLSDNIRQMMLTMVDDVRVVVIKLAEHCYYLRKIAYSDIAEQQRAAILTQHIYAPLANRLGISIIKWELEDFAFRYSDPIIYQQLARQVGERRISRENFIEQFVQTLSGLLREIHVAHEINGRAKHIYSIHKKMQKKNLPFHGIYDANAVRILVDDIESCYKVLSVVHEQWLHLPDQFDDYIATPKPNGYQSIHTVITANDKNIEVQIRTYEMHEKNEMGGAAHWLYKEGTKQSPFEQKIIWLRELLDWQQELVANEDLPEHLQNNFMDDRVYVFTPNGDVISLTPGCTALDFAYHIHSDVGHRCRGAKVNDKIATLTQVLRTGDKVEIVTGKEAKPSRDWLNSHAGYLFSSRAKAKVHAWFRKQDYDKNIIEGQTLIDREFKRLHIKSVKLSELASKFHLANEQDLLAAVGAGDIRINQILHFIQPKAEVEKPEFILKVSGAIKPRSRTGIIVEGVGDLVTHIAGCCKPLPGDLISGYSSHDHGVTIHRQDCLNLNRQLLENPDKQLQVSWSEVQQTAYRVGIHIESLEHPDVLRDISMLLSQLKVNLIDLRTEIDIKRCTKHLFLTINIPNIEQLNQLLQQLQQLPNIYHVTRL